MKFRTEIIPSIDLKLNLETEFYSIGSCFSNMVGEKLSENKFNCTSNPFGIIYNPISIFNLLKGKTDFNNSMIINDGIWYNYQLHSDFRNANKDVLIKNIKSKLSESKQNLNNSNVTIITFGTSFVYKLKESNEIVANCHKTPQQNFTRDLLSVKQIIQEFEKCGIDKLSSNIILTVSPVRHIKDTIELDSVSKSNLRIACHELQRQFSNVHYFPSYEIMMDDLRDYRYYKDDLLHPTSFAENYIWKKFYNSIFDDQTLKFIQDWKNIKFALNHKPFNPNSEKHQSFINQQIKKIKNFNSKLDFSKEIDSLKSQLIQ